MPLYREWNSDAYSLAAIWKIEEPEAFFLERTGVVVEVKDEHKRLEHLAGRFLLRHLKEDFPLLTIKPDEHDKPRITSNEYYFSISHSWPYVAAVVSLYVEAGMDIQCWRPRMDRLQHKFLTPEEQLLFKNDPQLLTLAWSIKEAAYKWQGRRKVEFKEHMQIVDFAAYDDKYLARLKMGLLKNSELLVVEGFTAADFSCAYVVHEELRHPEYL